MAFARGPRPEENRPGTATDLLTQLAAGLTIEATSDRIADALREHAARAPTLLLLDNLESLPEGERAAWGSSCETWERRARPSWPCARPAPNWRASPAPIPCPCTGASGGRRRSTTPWPWPPNGGSP